MVPHLDQWHTYSSLLTFDILSNSVAPLLCGDYEGRWCRLWAQPWLMGFQFFTTVYNQTWAVSSDEWSTAQQQQYKKIHYFPGDSLLQSVKNIEYHVLLMYRVEHCRCNSYWIGILLFRQCVELKKRRCFRNSASKCGSKHPRHHGVSQGGLPVASKQGWSQSECVLIFFYSYVVTAQSFRPTVYRQRHNTDSKGSWTPALQLLTAAHSYILITDTGLSNQIS